METSTEDLQNHYDLLNANVLATQKELEIQNQSIYDYKNQLAVATALEGDYIQEIEMLQSKEKVQTLELQKKIKGLEEEIVKLRNDLSPELLRKSELIESLQLEIRERTKSTNKKVEQTVRNTDQLKAATEKNLKLTEDIKMLTSNITDIESNVELLQVQNVTLEAKKNELCGELDHSKQYLTCKGQELTEIKTLILKLQEDAFLMKLELESLKSNPLDPSKKGNSLFAEVEDSRIKTLQNIQQMKKNYINLKREVCSNLKQLSALRDQNFDLTKQLDTIKSCDEEYKKEIDALQKKVSDLEITMEEYKKDILKEHKFTGKNQTSSAVVEFANNTISAKWRDGVDVREKLNLTSKEKLKTFIEIQNANTELRKWRRKAQQLKVTIGKLESDILEIQLQNSPTNTTDSENKTQVAEQKMEQTPPLTYSKSTSDVQFQVCLKDEFVETRKKSSILDKNRFGRSLLLKVENIKAEPFEFNSSRIGEKAVIKGNDVNQISLACKQTETESTVCTEGNESEVNPMIPCKDVAPPVLEQTSIQTKEAITESEIEKKETDDCIATPLVIQSEDVTCTSNEQGIGFVKMETDIRENDAQDISELLEVINDSCIVISDESEPEGLDESPCKAKSANLNIFPVSNTATSLSCIKEVEKVNLVSVHAEYTLLTEIQQSTSKVVEKLQELGNKEHLFNELCMIEKIKLSTNVTELEETNHKQEKSLPTSMFKENLPLCSNNTTDIDHILVEKFKKICLVTHGTDIEQTENLASSNNTNSENLQLLVNKENVPTEAMNNENCCLKNIEHISKFENSTEIRKLEEPNKKLTEGLVLTKQLQESANKKNVLSVGKLNKVRSLTDSTGIRKFGQPKQVKSLKASSNATPMLVKKLPICTNSSSVKKHQNAGHTPAANKKYGNKPMTGVKITKETPQSERHVLKSQSTSIPVKRKLI